VLRLTLQPTGTRRIGKPGTPWQAAVRDTEMLVRAHRPRSREPATGKPEALVASERQYDPADRAARLISAAQSLCT
jgi:hypothetical protein